MAGYVDMTIRNAGFARLTCKVFALAANEGFLPDKESAISARDDIRKLNHGTLEETLIRLTGKYDNYPADGVFNVAVVRISGHTYGISYFSDYTN